MVAHAFFLVLLGTPPPAAGDGLDKLGMTLRPLLASAIPAVLFEKEYGWGNQAPTARGLRWHGVRPEIQKSPRNHGVWRKIRFTAQDLPGSLELSLSDLRTVDADRQSFKIFLAFQAGVEYEQQTWERGIRVLSHSARARLRLKLNLDCEDTMRLEPGSGFIPDIVFRLRITHAELSYDNLVFEHLAGMGGSAAKLMGEGLRSTLKQWKPSIERDLLARANSAIVRAADTREVRLGLGGLTREKKK